ncbi:probable xyloglucan galactosyltransferase GT20 [Carica papaya]|uniref:probable xyloglucan galactosyltransferase GT20 n=1 Tax=Carica papaya TaxID=3649 RepID=UPI000B8C7592|nr:probable xyloglucan galactosyltransferase GT20 [Carica papaya]
MAISVSKRKPRLPSKSKDEAYEVHHQHHSCLYTILCKILYRIPFAIFLLAIIFLWSSSTTIISGKIVHVCLSSRKLNNLYCLSAGSQPGFNIPVDVPLSSNNNSTSTVSTSIVDGDDDDDDVATAIRSVEEQLKVHRSFVSNNNYNEANSCNGKGVYVYDLPSKFNKDLVGQCSDMIIWTDFCRFFKNNALGEPIEELGKGWYHTHQYALEPIFHARVLKHPCRVYDENQAKLFYVPYYGGFDILRWHFKNVSNEVKDSLTLELMKWLESRKPWMKNSGKDHVFVLGKITWDFRRNNLSSWGTRLLELEEMKNPIKLLIERHPWEINDIGIPHPTFFHPHSDDEVISWQLKIMRSNRKTLVSFAGGARPNDPENIRSILINQCNGSNSSAETNGRCRLFSCKAGGCNHPGSVMTLFMESEFCLQPPGDSATRKSVFDSLISGCIPVLFNPFTAYYQYPWHLPEDYEKYSVLIDQDDVRKMKVNVVKRLMNVPLKEREDMRRYIVYELLPGLVYGDSDSQFQRFQDAFSITMNNLLGRVSRLE